MLDKVKVLLDCLNLKLKASRSSEMSLIWQMEWRYIPKAQEDFKIVHLNFDDNYFISVFFAILFTSIYLHLSWV